MTTPIYIPSRGRAAAIFDRQSTVKYFKDFDVTFVVPPDEVERYTRQMKFHEMKNVTVIACPEEGIAKTRHWIGLHAKRVKQRAFAMIDDDLTFNVRIGPENNKLRPTTPKDIKEMMTWLDGALKEYAHASVSVRAVANTLPMQKGPKETLFQLNKRTLRFLAYQTDKFLAMKHGRVVVMEDFDVNLQLLRSGHQNILHYWWAQDQRETGSAGGCSTYRTHAAHEASAHKLAELHSEFVTLRQKENKAAVSKAAEAFRNRTEVTIQWDRAYRSSQR